MLCENEHNQVFLVIKMIIYHVIRKDMDVNEHERIFNIIKYFICLLQPISHGECSNDNEKTFFANHANLVMEKMWYHTN
jgi:hypothetical protein